MCDDWAARKHHYVRGAHPADRMFGLHCGCVVIVPDFDRRKLNATMMDSQWLMMCSDNEGDCRVRDQIRRDNPLTDATVAAVYYYSDVGGLRWQ